MFSWFRLHDAGMGLEREIKSEQLTDPDQIWMRWTEISKSDPSSYALRGVRRVVERVFLDAADTVIALVLATSGIYGVLSYSVAQRTTEIGIRMAIGAPRALVLRMILADGFAWILPGILAGFLLCLAVTPLLAHLLYGVEPTNLANYAVMLIGVLIVSAFAAFLPACRAMKIDPLTALHYE